jgi:hypothetical protein
MTQTQNLNPLFAEILKPFEPISVRDFVELKERENDFREKQAEEEEEELTND